LDDGSKTMSKEGDVSRCTEGSNEGRLEGGRPKRKGGGRALSLVIKKGKSGAGAVYDSSYQSPGSGGGGEKGMNREQGVPM